MGEQQEARSGAPGLAGITVVLVLLGVAALSLLLSWITLWSLATPDHSDFGVYRNAVAAFWSGGQVYGVVLGYGPFMYPPFGAVALTPVAILPGPSGLLALVAIDLVVLLVVGRHAFRAVLERVAGRGARAWATAGVMLLALCLAPVSDALGLGQVGIVLMGLCFVDLVLLRGHRFQGVLTGAAIAVKLTSAVFLPYLLLTRQWRAAATVGVSTLAFTAVGWAARPQATLDFLGDRAILRVDDFSGGFSLSAFNQSLRSVLHRTVGEPWATPLWIVASVALLAVAYVAAARWWRSRGDALLPVSLLGLVGVLVAPVSWHHHAVWVLPAVGALLGDARTRWRTTLAVVATLLLVWPPRIEAIVPLPVDRFVVGYLVLVVGLLVVARRGGDAADSAPRIGRAETVAA